MGEQVHYFITYSYKVRLTFKMELDQLWLGTKERTEKLPMNSIKAVVSEPIKGQEEYHILALQLGPTEASRCNHQKKGYGIRIESRAFGMGWRIPSFTHSFLLKWNLGCIKWF